MIGRWPILLLISFECTAQTYLGPRHQAMGCTGAALQGIYSLTANPAGVTGLVQPVISVAHQHHFFASDITTQAGLIGIPTRLGTAGFAVSHYGLQGAYQELRMAVAYAKAFGPHFSLGLTANRHQLTVPSYLNSSGFSVDVGVQYRIGAQTVLGAYYANVGESAYRDVYSEVPSYLRAGAIHGLDKVVVTADAVYHPGERLGGHFGFEYLPGEWLALRGGLSVNPLQQHAGFGVRWGGFILDVAATFHPWLGASPQIGLCYAF